MSRATIRSGLATRPPVNEIVELCVGGSVTCERERSEEPLGSTFLRRRRIFLLFLCSLVLLATGTYVVLVYTGASRSFVENIVGRFIRRFSLRDAEVDPASGTVRLEGVQIGHPTLEEADVLLQAILGPEPRQTDDFARQVRGQASPVDVTDFTSRFTEIIR